MYLFTYLVSATVPTVFGHSKLKSQWEGDKQGILDNTSAHPRRIVSGARSEARKHRLTSELSVIRRCKTPNASRRRETKQTRAYQNI